MMPQRRAMFGMSDGQANGAAPQTAMPFTGTGTGNDADGDYDGSAPGSMDADMFQESPASLRRRIMPIAGSPAAQTDALSVMRQALAPPVPPKLGGY